MTVPPINSATASKGKTFPGERQLVNLNLKPDTLARAKSRGFRLVNQLSLPPGRYQLRIAAATRNGRTGSVLYDLEVPDFSKEKFVMSGVSLTSAAAEGARYAATVDRPLESGVERTRAQVAGAISARFARDVTATQTVVDGVPVVRVDVVAEVPPLGLWGPGVGLAVSGHAIEEVAP